MALSGNYAFSVSYQPILPAGFNAQAVTPTAAADAAQSVDGAYVRVDGLSGDKTLLNLAVGVYTKQADGVLVRVVAYSFVPSVASDSSNFLMQAYEYLKTLPEFANFVDVLEDGQTA